MFKNEQTKVLGSLRFAGDDLICIEHGKTGKHSASFDVTHLPIHFIFIISCLFKKKENQIKSSPKTCLTQTDWPEVNAANAKYIFNSIPLILKQKRDWGELKSIRWTDKKV